MKDAKKLFYNKFRDLKKSNINSLRVRLKK